MVLCNTFTALFCKIVLFIKLFFGMDKFFEKLSLYDILSMVIPGGIILLFFLKCVGFGWRVNDAEVDSKIVWGFGFLVSYIIGIGNHVLSKKLWGNYRCNPLFLKQSLKNVKNKNTDELNRIAKEVDFDDVTVYVMYSYLSFCVPFIASLCVLMLRCYIIFEKNDRLYGSLYAFLLLLPFVVVPILMRNVSHSNDEKLVYEYNTAYTYVQQNSKNADISVIEGQIAFLQSMVVPTTLMIALLASNNSYLIVQDSFGKSYNWLAFGGGIIVFLSLFLLIYYRTMKVHEIVWDYYECLKRI